SPLFLEFLQGNWQLECTPWGNPTYNLFGWQKPCYLLDEGYVETFQELLDTTDWDAYGRASGNPRCRNCMMHCGYEPWAVSETFGSLRGLTQAARSVIFPARQRPVAAPANNRSATPASVLPILGETPSSGGCGAHAGGRSTDSQSQPPADR